jgi:hypothetical protein
MGANLRSLDVFGECPKASIKNTKRTKKKAETASSGEIHCTLAGVTFYRPLGADFFLLRALRALCV